MTVNQSGHLDSDSGGKQTIGDRLETLEDTVEQLETVINKLELRLFNLEQMVGTWPPVDVEIAEEPSNRCPKCNLDFTGAMGYVCSDTACPYGVSSVSFPMGLNTGG